MKNRYTAALLAFFLGGFGAHKFYLGKWTGIFYIILCWTSIPSIIALIEGILYLANGEYEFNEKYNNGGKQRQQWSRYYQQPTPNHTNQNIFPDLGAGLSKVCPKCRKENDSDSNFCEACGQLLEL